MAFCPSIKDSKQLAALFNEEAHVQAAHIDAETKEAFPFCHGATSAETFLMDAARVIREDFMARDPDCINFNVVALCKE